MLILEHLFSFIHCISADRSIISKISNSSWSIRSIRSWKCQPDPLLFSRFHARFITHSTKGPSNRPRRPIQRFRRKTGDRQRSEAAAGQTSTTNNLSPTLRRGCWSRASDQWMSLGAGGPRHQENRADVNVAGCNQRVARSGEETDTPVRCKV